MDIPADASSSLTILKLVLEDLKKNHNLSAEEAIKVASPQSAIGVPVSIFVQELTVLEALTKHLREKRKQTYADIARTLGRDTRSVWGSYRRAATKHPGPLPEDPSSDSIPLSLFDHPSLSASEALLLHLRDTRSYRFADIARMLHRDPRTIWAMYQSGARKSRREGRK